MNLIRKKQHYFFKALFWITAALTIYQPFFIIPLPSLFFISIDRTESLKASLPFILWIIFFPIAFHFRYLTFADTPYSEYAEIHLMNYLIDPIVFRFGIFLITFLTLLHFYVTSLQFDQKGNPSNYLPLPFKLKLSYIHFLIIFSLFSLTITLGISDIDSAALSGRLINLFRRDDGLNEERLMTFVLCPALTINFMGVRYLIILRVEKMREKLNL